MDRLLERFRLDLNEKDAAKYMISVIDNAYENRMSIVYDYFQLKTNGIRFSSFFGHSEFFANSIRSRRYPLRSLISPLYTRGLSSPLLCCVFRLFCTTVNWISCEGIIPCSLVPISHFRAIPCSCIVAERSGYSRWSKISFLQGNQLAKFRKRLLARFHFNSPHFSPPNHLLPSLDITAILYPTTLLSPQSRIDDTAEAI